jgi:large subunit ribosomal protein L9
MQIILKTDFPKLGSAGNIVSVKDGYARNFLLPRGIAVPANKSNLKIMEEGKRIEAMQKGKERRTASKLAENIAKISITTKVKTGDEDKIFGSVTSQDIAELLKEKGFDIERKKIDLAEPIKTLGVYQIPLKLHPEVEARVKLWVIKQD